MIKTLLLSAPLAMMALTAQAESPQFVLGPGGNLYRAIEPEIYLSSIQIEDLGEEFEWCVWPLGCWGGGGDIVPIPPSEEFSRSMQLDAARTEIAEFGFTLDTVATDYAIVSGSGAFE